MPKAKIASVETTNTTTPGDSDDEFDIEMDDDFDKNQEKMTHFVQFSIFKHLNTYSFLVKSLNVLEFGLDIA